MTGEDECEECITCNYGLDWDLYCDCCKTQFTRKDIDDYYAKLCVESEKELIMRLEKEETE